MSHHSEATAFRRPLRDSNAVVPDVQPQTVVIAQPEDNLARVCVLDSVVNGFAGNAKQACRREVIFQVDPLLTVKSADDAMQQFPGR